MAVVRAIRALFVAAMLAAAPGAAYAQSSLSPPDGSEEHVETAPVTLDGIELFRVRGMQTYAAQRRADAISARILELARDPKFELAEVDTQNVEGWVWIGDEKHRLMRVYPADGQVESIEHTGLADIYAIRIREAISAYRVARSRPALVAAGWRAAIATVLAVLVFFVLRFLLRLLSRWEARNAQKVKSVSISSFEVVGAHHIWGIVRGALRLVFALGVAVLAEIYLQNLLGCFPWTAAAGRQLSGWIFAPLQYFGRGLLAMIPDLIFLLILFLITRYTLRLIKSFFDSVGQGTVELKGFYPEWAGPTYDLVRVSVLAFSIVLAYPHIPGASSDAFKGVSIFVGAILSLGSTGVISNIIAGYTMVYRRAFREGDLIQIESVIGFVSKIRLQVTHLRTPRNEEVIIPNSKILNSEVINFSTLAGSDGLLLHTTVGIGYETPWRQVEAMLVEAAGRTEGLLKSPPPFVREKALGDFAVTYMVLAYCKVPDEMFRIYSDLHAHILDVFNEHGVQIMTPAYEGDPQQPKVVPREAWFLPPAVPPAAPTA